MNHAGYLVKQGAVVKNWKRRWFVISGTVLSYYKGPRDHNPKGRIDLEVHTVEEMDGYHGHEYAFSLVPNDGTGRVYYLYAITPDERTRWVEALNKGKISYWKQLAMTAEQGRLQAESERESLHHELADTQSTRDRLESDVLRLRHVLGSQSHDTSQGMNPAIMYDPRRYGEDSDSDGDDIATINMYGSREGLLTLGLPRQAAIPTSLIMEGWMVKRGEKRKSWLKRWFRLERQADTHLPQMFYFKNDKAAKKSALGHIDILSYSIREDASQGRDYCICLENAYVPGARTFYLCALDLAQLKRWVRALHDSKIQFYHARIAIEKQEYENQMGDIRQRQNSAQSRNPRHFVS